MGKYLHYFLTKADYIKKYFSDEYKKHWTSLTTPGYKSNYDITKKKLALTPLTLVPLTNNSTTFTFAIGANVNTDVLQSISYSTDGGETWTKTNNVDGTAVNITAAVTNKQPVMFIGEGDAISVSESVYSKITANKNFAAFGNPLSLLSQRYRLNSLANHPFALSHLFSTAGKLVYANGLILSAKTCGNSCYSRMFENCSLLETFPELPATKIGNYCYYYMFQNCSKMITPPTLPATKLGTYCYSYMFTGCSGLTSVPELPAMNLTNYCYNNMFRGCTGLTNPTIILPAITMSAYCYSDMFNGCNKLTSVPQLPSTSLAPYCYGGMFSGCSKLNTVPLLPATTLEISCYQYMFYNCTSLTQLPTLPATNLKNTCYQYMFSGCTSLSDIPELPATQLYDQCYKEMFSNCKGLTDLSEHTFPIITSGANAYVYMFKGCSNLTKAPVLPTLTLTGNYFYRGMFQNCTSLIQAPELPATVGKPWCYAEMFSGCTSLTTMPTIHLNTLPGASCFQSMFSGCTSLVNVMDILPWTTLQNACYNSMFNGCTSLTTAPKLPAQTLLANCYNSMFKNCTNLNSVTALFTTEPNSVTTCNANWLSGVSATGTFVMSSAAEWDPDDYRNVNGIPEGWTVQTYVNPTVDVTFMGAHLENSGSMIEGIPTTITVVPDTGYIFEDAHVDIIMNNINVTSQCTITITSNLITITTPNVTGNITIDGAGAIIEM